MDGSKDMRRVVLVAMVVMLVFAGQASAGFKTCYGACYLECIVKTHQPCACAFKCLKDCIVGPDDSTTPNSQYYCHVACSLFECANKYSNDSDKMESCVDNCSTNVCSLN